MGRRQAALKNWLAGQAHPNGKLLVQWEISFKVRRLIMIPEGRHSALASAHVGPPHPHIGYVPHLLPHPHTSTHPTQHTYNTHTPSTPTYTHHTYTTQSHICHAYICIMHTTCTYRYMYILPTYTNHMHIHISHPHISISHTYTLITYLHTTHTHICTHAS